MNLLESNIQEAITATLREEIELFRKSDRAKLLNEETFDPSSPQSCFLGQTGQNSNVVYDSNDTASDLYRETIGRVPRGFGIRGYHTMTPLEIWSAYYWNVDKELVLNVLRYIKGEIDIYPEIEFAEAKAA